MYNTCEMITTIKIKTTSNPLKSFLRFCGLSILDIPEVSSGISWFQVSFPLWLYCWEVFHVSSIVKCLFKYFTHFFSWHCFLITEFASSLLYFRYKSFIRYFICKYFPPACDLSFRSLNRIFWREVLNFWWNPNLLHIFFYRLYFWSHMYEIFG